MRYVSTRGQRAGARLRRRAARRPGRRRRPVRAGGRGRRCPTTRRRRGATPSRAAAVMAPFVGDEIDRATCSRPCAHDAYATFDHPAVVPARAARRPTSGCSSCSTARRWRSRTSPCSSSAGCSTTCSRERGERVTIVGATSATPARRPSTACRDCANVDIVMLYPAGRVSEVQRRQMTTVDAPNVHNVAVEGTFDDCQDLVKAMFADAPFRERHAPVGGELDQLGPGDGPDRLLRDGRGRTSAAGRCRSPCRPATSATCSPAGSPGAMGAPIDRLVVGSNRNDILTRFVDDGDHGDRATSCRRSARAWTSRCRRTSSGCCSS